MSHAFNIHDPLVCSPSKRDIVLQCLINGTVKTFVVQCGRIKNPKGSMSEHFKKLRDIKGGAFPYAFLKRWSDEHRVELQIGSTIDGRSGFKPETDSQLSRYCTLIRRKLNKWWRFLRRPNQEK